MAKDRTFNMRLDDEDRERLDLLAKHYCAPAAVAVRMLIKEKHDGLKNERPRANGSDGL